MAWKVLFFQAARGDGPVEEFIKRQDEATYAKILHYILLLKNNGPFLKPPYNKKLQNTLYELRVPGKNATRILYTMLGSEYYILHAFNKKTQKTPRKDLKLALDRMRKVI